MNTNLSPTRSLSEVRQHIREIDKEIDANRRELHRRQKVRDVYSAAAWQDAWDAEPELLFLDGVLFTERGLAQSDRDFLENRDFVAKARAEARRRRNVRPRRCPTCGIPTFKAA